MANAGGGSWTWVWPAARRRVGVVGLVACLAIGDVGRCCDNPVFRYALENWPSAEYLLVTAGAEAAADAARIDQLLAVAEPRPNLRLASAGELPQLDASGPLVLLAPAPPRGQPGRPQVTWSGPASEESLARVVDSPARRELVKRLLDGEAIVWVVLEVSDREAIDKGEAALQQLIDGYLEALAQAEAAAAATGPPPQPAGTSADRQVGLLAAAVLRASRGCRCGRRGGVRRDAAGHHAGGFGSRTTRVSGLRPGPRARQPAALQTRRKSPAIGL